MATARGACRVGLKEIGAIGQIHEGFKIVRREPFPDLAIEVMECVHDKTGAKLVHIDTEDTNNVFCVGFCTPAVDDTGVSHILEHTSLCGSENFPIRDPFFKMRKRSLCTFMNAMTSPDATMYPFSTVNEQDFHNLMNVYMDAVFLPKLSKMDFLQEGHRLEIDDGGNHVIKGVVFNEMKGHMSDPGSCFFMKTMNNIYGKESCYGHEYGGNPKFITTLTHDDLLAFHKAHYNPTNSTITTYGDLPVLKTFKKLDSVLSKVYVENQERKYLQAVAAKPSEPMELSSVGPCNPMMNAEQSGKRIAVSWVLDIATDDVDTIFAVELMGSLLTSGPSAPMNESLIESGLGTDFTSGTGFSTFLKGGFFEIGIQGVKDKTSEEIQNVIMGALEKTLETGFPQNRIESALHQVELSKAHRPAGWGMHVTTALSHALIQGYDAMSVFESSKRVATFRERMAEDPNYLVNFTKLLINNTHRQTHQMDPSEAFPADLASHEENIQTPQLAEGTDPDFLKKQAADLKEEMDKEEDVSVLPTLHADKDVPTDPLPDPACVQIEGKKLPIQNVLTPTNGIWYFRLVLPINHLTKEEVLRLPLLSASFGETGVKGGYDYKELSQEFELCSSGIRCSSSIGKDPKETDTSRSYFVVTSYGLERNWDRFCELLKSVVDAGNLDSSDEQVRTRVKNIISAEATTSMGGLIGSAHALAMVHAGSQLDGYAKCSEATSGVAQTSFLSDLMLRTQASEEALTEIIDDLNNLVNKIVTNTPKGSKLSVTTTTRMTDDQVSKLTSVMEGMTVSSEPEISTLKAAAENVGETGGDVAKKSFVTIPVDKIGFAAVAKKSGLSTLHPDAPASEVVLKIIDTKFLHKEVREKGGAYGSGAVNLVAGDASMIGCYSYRDPACGDTIATFEKCLEWATIPGNITEDDINEAKIMLFSGIDAPKSPQNMGLRPFLTSMTMDDVRERRRRLLAVTVDDAVRMAKTLSDIPWQSTAVFGGETVWETFKDDNTWSKFDKMCEARAA
eukprot:TRINITY_DN1289_c0_g1_i1.p1 TRINITY_DN1289_c0_g1~~TRINITY_DN1289_c0_g1_i1.p1  ORF type:complete len:1016 (+),score=218.74 TRINITY_DN1289_c0_g1_i1:62-3109(+)